MFTNEKLLSEATFESFILKFIRKISENYFLHERYIKTNHQ